MRTLPNVLIPTRDGIELSGDLFLPDTNGPVPVIIKYYPYRKDDTCRELTIPRARYFSEHGYGVMLLDVRGTGSSGGICDRMLRLQEWEDGYDAIEWIASQSWCDGSVAMTGVSYGGFSSLLTAAQAPPHLKAIAPIYAGWDLYENGHPGGMWQSSIWSGIYNAFMTALGAAPPRPDKSGRWLEVWEEHLAGMEPWLHSFMTEPTDPSWREGSVRYELENIKCATFIIGGWHDIFVADPFQIYAGIHPDVPRKLMMGPYLHIAPNIGLPGPRIDHLHEIVRWFDQHLKNIDTGIDEEPPINIWVRGYDEPRARRETAAGDWRSEAEWPPDRAEKQTFYLNADGVLGSDSPTTAPGHGVDLEIDPAIGVSTMGMLTGLGSDVGLPLDQRREAKGSVVALSEPLSESVHVAGFPQATVFLSSTAEVTAVSVKLIDVHPDGPWALATRGILNTSRRKSRESPEPLVPGEVTEITFDLEPMYYLFDKGHRIGLLVTAAEFPLLWPPPEGGTNRIHMNGSQATRITLPVVAESDSGLPAPDYKDAPDVPAPWGAAEPLIWDVEETLNGTEVRVVISMGGNVDLDVGGRVATHAELIFSTRRDDPARTRAEASYAIDLENSVTTTRVRATSTVQGTKDAFHGITAVDVTAEKMPRFHKTWHKTVPRRFL